ncbi:hypothetical protein K2173_002181 [Erythroxylum novogranatense]|uniref:Homeobox domain-containing protein n=1 Tax=Erythroxylum novogranatense TaxID=1862640 RepID=A0AAV8S6W2_9ROSI|nr:hypothetical protein K2173_002181 [Erythroxylum novogranatense]
MGDLGVDKELNEQTTSWGRWSPTPEQLLALEAIYKQGIRTPTTEQIQKIAATLRRLGKIEGRNVYYWFQNHKARERYKRRRQVQHDNGKQTMDMKESVFELEHLKRIAIPTGFPHASEKELQERSTDQEDYANWRPIQSINSSTTTSIELLNLHQGKSSLKPNNRENHDNYLEDETREVQTLQLFPCRRGDNCYLVNDIEEDKNVPIRVINTNFSPNKFFEFLPLKK